VSGPKSAYYAASVPEFLAQPAESIVNELTARAVSESNQSTNLRQQQQAWVEQVTLLQATLAKIPDARDWGLVLEYSLHRLGRRPDAVLLTPGVIIVIEFKMGAKARGHKKSYTDQAVDYALCIRDFHGGARDCVVAPIVCVQHAPTYQSEPPEIIDKAAEVIRSNAADLFQSLRVAAALAKKPCVALTWQEFLQAPYNPTPTIVEAARALYGGHQVSEIGRADSSGESRERTKERLNSWVSEARRSKSHIICFVTGSPGSGKSLLGLNLILKEEGTGRVAGEPAAFLTGNRPLVHVLRKALIQDAKARGKHPEDTKRAVEGALQTLLGYLRQHTGESATVPPERVVVFDEAQRAWDEKTGKKLFRRESSEPALFLEILGQLDWACLVCLIGAGQEINVGEGGVKLWEQAILAEAKRGHPWHVVCANPQELTPDLLHPSRLDPHLSKHLWPQVDEEPDLYTFGSVRSYRNPDHVEWVDALLAGEIPRAAEIATTMREESHYPPMMTRDLSVMKKWLKLRRRGRRRIGLVVSSGAAERLRAEGVHVPPTSAKLAKIERWFLKVHPDFLSSDVLELPMSEFGCQGLELDYIGLTWGTDLIWMPEQAKWRPRKLHAGKWNNIHDLDNAQFRKNSYRVLLTRAREGVCIFVPRGSHRDPTRSVEHFNSIAQILIEAGCQEISGEAHKPKVRRKKRLEC